MSDVVWGLAAGKSKKLFFATLRVSPTHIRNVSTGTGPHINPRKINEFKHLNHFLCRPNRIVGSRVTYNQISRLDLPGILLCFLTHWPLSFCSVIVLAYCTRTLQFSVKVSAEVLKIVSRFSESRIRTCSSSTQCAGCIWKLRTERAFRTSNCCGMVLAPTPFSASTMMDLIVVVTAEKTVGQP